MKRSRRNLLKVVATILLIVAATVAITLSVTKRTSKVQATREEANRAVVTENTNRPKCADVKCYDDSIAEKRVPVTAKQALPLATALPSNRHLPRTDT